MVYLGKDRVNLNPNFAASSPAGLGAQADWAETDVNAAAYIKNKPLIARTHSSGTIEGNITSNDASGDYSHAEGYNTVASGNRSHAEGQQTTASGGYSHAEGFGATASGETSHAEGIYTTASVRGSHAEGSYTTAASVSQHAQGRYNIIDNQNIYADIVGNGYSDSHRSNAYTLDWEGNGWFANSVTVGTDPVDAMNLTTKRYVDNLLTPTFNIVAAKNSNQLIEINAFNSTSTSGAYIWEINMDGTKTTLFSINSILTLNAEQTAAYDAATTITVQVAVGYTTSSQVTLKGE